jgi:hypothetical protein
MIRNLSLSQKSSHIQNICALGGRPRRFLGLLLASSCPHAHGGEVSSVIAPRAQAYPQRQRPWVINRFVSLGQLRLGPASSPAFTMRQPLTPFPNGAATDLKDSRPGKANPGMGLLPPCA